MTAANQTHRQTIPSVADDAKNHPHRHSHSSHRLWLAAGLTATGACMLLSSEHPWPARQTSAAPTSSLVDGGHRSQSAAPTRADEETRVTGRDFTATAINSGELPEGSVDDDELCELLPTTDHLFGIVRPSQAADLPSLVPGVIRRVHVFEGQFVRHGSPLATLDDRIPRARLQAAIVEANLTGALQRAETELRMAESRLQRLQQATALGAGASFEIEEAVAVRDQAQAAVHQQRDLLKAAAANRDLAEAQLAMYTITAPFDGVVTEIHRSEGVVDVVQPVISIANMSVLETELHLPAALYGTVRIQQSVQLDASEPVSQQVPATVVSVSPVINSASNTFRCLLRIDNAATSLPGGFTVTLHQPTSTEGSKRALAGATAGNPWQRPDAAFTANPR
ncbi:MAG: efflux RND transporter periplasmic adaptor subunit [Planctomycetaceae bacterium]|nr:efflux RND transporter periplasmic adaptor subunit [Planctomycetaceae bacterium]